MKLTPIYAIAQDLNAQFIDRAGWQVPASFSALEAEVAAARDGVALADLSANGKLTVEGRRALDFLQTIWKLPPLEISQGATIETGFLDRKFKKCKASVFRETRFLGFYRLRADLFFIAAPPGLEAEVEQTLTGAALSFPDLITVTDLTHGRAELRLIGPASAELLSRLCSLDFHPAAFPNLTARQSSVAKTAQLIIRADLVELPAFSLIGASSLGAYLWETIMKAGRDLGIAPVGQTAIERLG